ncbi:hypothetical protein [Streptomyces sp. NPDC048603]|uniref:hypothetical protein n=1 Tax=Streptomyces sp. NPDC048603 TaxID=3365577 RepID=UPI00371CCFCA
MSAQAHESPTDLPDVRTVDDLRNALGRFGFPGDRENFERELAEAIGSAPTNDLEPVAAVVRAYRHRLTIANSPAIMDALAAAHPGGSST